MEAFLRLKVGKVDILKKKAYEVFPNVNYDRQPKNINATIKLQII